MIVILDNQVGHLVEGVLAAVLHVLCDIRNFRPDDEAALVAQVVKVLGVLVVRQAHGVGTHLAQQGQVLLMFGIGQRVAQALAVLVAGRTAQAIGAAIE